MDKVNMEFYSNIGLVVRIEYIEIYSIKTCKLKKWINQSKSTVNKIKRKGFNSIQIRVFIVYVDKYIQIKTLNRNGVSN